MENKFSIEMKHPHNATKNDERLVQAILSSKRSPSSFACSGWGFCHRFQPKRRKFTDMFILQLPHVVERVKSVNQNMFMPFLPGQLCQKSQNQTIALKRKGAFQSIDLFLLVELSEPLFCNGLLKIQVRDWEEIPETMVSQSFQTGLFISAHTWIVRTSIDQLPKSVSFPQSHGFNVEMVISRRSRQLAAAIYISYKSLFFIYR